MDDVNKLQARDVDPAVRIDVALFVDKLIDAAFETTRPTSSERMYLVNAVGRTIEHAIGVAFAHVVEVLDDTARTLYHAEPARESQQAFNARMGRVATLRQQAQAFKGASRSDVAHVVDRVIDDAAQGRL
jgi:hypothetical protein